MVLWYVDHRVVSLEIPDNVSRQQEKSDDKREAELDVRAGKRAGVPSNNGRLRYSLIGEHLLLRAGPVQAKAWSFTRGSLPSLQNICEGRQE
jgi:hypothetical protein